MNTDTSFLLGRIEEAAAQRGLAPSTLCQLAVKNSKLPIRLQEGKSVTLRTVGKLNAWMEANPPLQRAKAS